MKNFLYLTITIFIVSGISVEGSGLQSAKQENAVNQDVERKPQTADTHSNTAESEAHILEIENARSSPKVRKCKRGDPGYCTSNRACYKEGAGPRRCGAGNCCELDK